MRKLMLDLNALEVETFVTEEQEGERGTVGAAEASADCHTQKTRGWSCDKTGCPGSCK